MRVHHLNCGTMRASGMPIVCHVLLLEAAEGLVLVDSGFGLADVADPRRLGGSRHLTRPVLDREEAAVLQVERLGYSRDDVRHVVLTHLDVDHVGGISDFPDAQVHLTAAEARGAVHAPSWRERLRYRPVQWSHGPLLVEHGPGGDSWRGFSGARELTDVADGLVLVPLPGHTRGHAAVAVDTGDGWLLHAGDAFYHHGVLDGSARTPRAIAVMESLIAWDRAQVRDNHARLAELHQREGEDVTVFSAHDGTQLAALQAVTPSG